MTAKDLRSLSYDVCFFDRPRYLRVSSSVTVLLLGVLLFLLFSASFISLVSLSFRVMVAVALVGSTGLVVSSACRRLSFPHLKPAGREVISSPSCSSILQSPLYCLSLDGSPTRRTTSYLVSRNRIPVSGLPFYHLLHLRQTSSYQL